MSCLGEGPPFKLTFLLRVKLVFYCNNSQVEAETEVWTFWELWVTSLPWGLGFDVVLL